MQMTMNSRLESFIERIAPLVNSGRSAADKLVSDSALKRELQALYRHYFGQTLRGCKNCQFDGMIRLYSIYKNGSYMKKTEKFRLRRGVVLVAENRRYNMTRGYETDELALYHLSKNPACESKFEILPDEEEIETMMEAYLLKQEAKAKAKADKEGGVDLTEQIIADANEKAAAITKEAELEATKIIAEAEKQAKSIIAKAETTPPPTEHKKAKE